MEDVKNENVTEEKQETMDDYKDMIDASFHQVRTGDIMNGTVSSIEDDEILVDLEGYYTPGVVKKEDASDDPDYTFAGHVEQGQTITAAVVSRDDGAGRVRLSMKEAAALEAWDRLRELVSTQANVEVKISGITKGGAVAYLEGVRGFIPASRLSAGYVEEDAMNGYLNKPLTVRVLEADEETKHLILSAREIEREKERAARAARVSSVTVGTVTEGTVETIKDYGAFIDLGDGLSGLLHVSQISNKRIKTPAAVLTVGQKVTVKVIANKDGKLSLSMKALEEVAAEEIREPEEKVEIPQSEEIGTSLGSLFAKLKL